MSRGATQEGTTRYAEKFRGIAADGHFRKVQGLVFSSLGIGTYLGQPNDTTDASYAAAIVAAVESGINVIDTAINYRLQRSERSVGTALKVLAHKGFLRSEIVVCTKAGYLTPDGSMPTDPNRYFFEEYIQRGIFGAKDIAAGCHCMTPRFLENQLIRSLKNLGVETVDVFYLHNPETQLTDIPRLEFLNRVREAFGFLESAVSAGRVQFYGLATWNGFRKPASAPDAVQLAELEAIAKEVAGEKHHFRFVQLPFNLAMTEALTLGNQNLGAKERTIMEAADELGITLIASASLLQGQVAQNLPEFVAEALGLGNDTERALQFVRSAPGITTALVGMSRTPHVEANARLVEAPPAGLDQFRRLFSQGEGA
ncbi:MAG TPA: aldo/keto reductase [Candidatus Limnocylindrales bacterium]|nr:aldo/keto reductase [Candidatus Limnocylindrales bacterium]